MAPRISPETEKRIARLFPPDQRKRVRKALSQECGNNLPLLQNHDAVKMERIRFAVLKLSEGRLDKLARAIALAKADWRDLLMAADFGQPDAHVSWLPERRPVRDEGGATRRRS
jgi:hypothetical protein